jgi:16S rRNA U516 pseudouridylate synthase RsuA-like enzyme
VEHFCVERCDGSHLAARRGDAIIFDCPRPEVYFAFTGEFMLPDSSTRLNKYISESGICSRREADRYIEQGNVFINGKRATIGDQVNPGDVVKVNGQLIEPREAEDLVFIALNKPVGIVSTRKTASATTLWISLTTASVSSRLVDWIKTLRG